MIVRPRNLKSVGLLGAAIFAATPVLAQTPTAQTDAKAPYASPQGRWGATASGQSASARPWPASGSAQAGLPSPQSKKGWVSSNGASGQSGPGASGQAMPGAASGAGAGGAGTGAAGMGAGAGTGAGGAAGGVTGDMTPPAPGATAADTAPSPSAGLGGGLSGGSSYFGMMGDQPPIARTFQIRVPSPPDIPNPGQPPTPPGVRPGIGRAVAVLPSVRGFKISENQSPAPQDRIYFSFNYYDNLNQKVNERFDSAINNIKVYRYVVGLEKTLLEGRASVGLRLPIDSLSTSSRFPTLAGTSQASGDLAAIAKYALIQDRDAGRLFSVGLLMNMPTGPRSFAGAPGIRSPHNPALQPFVGFIRQFGDLYFQGFSAVDVPLNPNDVTMFYNDIGAGYYIYRSDDLTQLITAIAPTFEVHINTPLNHRNPYNLNDLAGSYDYVNLTMGANFQIRKRGLLALAIVEPVTGPQPFHLETIVQFNLRF